jgi:hypothetical protein
MLASLGHPQYDATKLYQDNQAAIQMNLQGGGTFKRSKHLLARHCFVTQNIRDGEVIPVYLPTDKIIVDMLTKDQVRMDLERNRTDAHIVYAISYWKD